MTDESNDQETKAKRGGRQDIGGSRRTRLSQEDVPGFSLDQALRVARALADNYAYGPTRPINVAAGMGVTPTSGFFRGVTGAALAYGLTTGGYNATEIGLTPLGLRIVRPTSEGDDVAARREALLRPRIVGEFLRQYDGAALPAEKIAKNVLLEKGVPGDRLDDVYDLIIGGAESVGFLRELGGRRYLDLTGSAPSSTSTTSGQTNSEIGGSSVRGATTDAVEAPATGRMASAPSVAVSSGININLEIHIAADASTQTIEDIFRSMSRYVLKSEEPMENEE